MPRPTPLEFVRAHTRPAPVPLVPEIELHLATEITPVWEATERELKQSDTPPPYWAFCWPGSQALARYFLDHPQVIAGKRVLDFAAGSGIAAIAAIKAGAASVTANDVDPLSCAATRLNAQHNRVQVDIIERDLLDDESPPDADLICAGDICYEQPLAARVAAWLRRQAARGVTVWMGDPGRNFLPPGGLEEIAHYDVPTSQELEDGEIKRAVVWRVGP